MIANAQHQAEGNHNLLDEDIITLTQAARIIPGRPSAQSMYRYTGKHGRKGADGQIHVLESILSCKQRWTSTQAIRRWLNAINAPAAGAVAPASPSIRGRQKAAAGKELEAILG